MSPVDVAEVAEKFEMEDTVEKLRTGDGHDEMAGVGEMDGEGDPERSRGGGEAPASSLSLYSSMISPFAGLKGAVRFFANFFAPIINACQSTSEIHAEMTKRRCTILSSFAVSKRSVHGRD